MSNENWYIKLQKIDKKDKIVAIAVKPKGYDNEKESRLFKQLKSAKEMLDYDFDSGYGGSEGPHFTAWTDTNVYFPCTYDGSEWIQNIPRNPVKLAQGHIGGE